MQTTLRAPTGVASRGKSTGRAAAAALPRAPRGAAHLRAPQPAPTRAARSAAAAPPRAQVRRRPPPGAAAVAARRPPLRAACARRDAGRRRDG